MKLKAGECKFISTIELVANTIRHQIEFSKEYQEIGVICNRQNVREMVMKTASVFKMDGVTLSVNCKDIEILADPLLQKVFYNLFDNAFRYAPPFSSINVSCSETDGGMEVVFEDDGAGIGEDDRKHLFERGFGKNTGLGLFLHGRSLRLPVITITENGEPGKGARFEIRVPKGITGFPVPEKSREDTESPLAVRTSVPGRHK